jgi:hypothetical protein
VIAQVMPENRIFSFNRRAIIESAWNGQSIGEGLGTGMEEAS